MTPEIKIASIEDLEILLPLVQAFHEFEDLRITDEREHVTSLREKYDVGQDYR